MTLVAGGLLVELHIVGSVALPSGSLFIGSLLPVINTAFARLLAALAPLVIGGLGLESGPNEIGLVGQEGSV